MNIRRQRRPDHFIEPLRVGLVGCGFAARDRHLPALRRVEETALVAAADVDPAALEKVLELAGPIRTYSDPQQLLDDPSIEAVAVCTPADQHVPIALAALRAGKHVLIEKPLCLSLREADLLSKAEGASHRILVGFNMRWHRLITEARREIGSGSVGRIEHVHSTFTDPLNSRPLPAWRTQRSKGGGALIDKAIHHFDLWRFLLADEVEEVASYSRSDARGDDTTVVVIGRLSSGGVATLVASDATRVRNELVISGDAGEISVNCYQFDGIERAHVDELRGDPRARLRGLGGALLQIGDAFRGALGAGVFARSYDAEWRHFVELARGRTEPGCTLRDGRKALEIALAAAHATLTRRAVRVADAPETASLVGNQSSDRGVR